VATRLALFFLWLVHFLPLSALAWLGERLGSLLYRSGRGRITRINLGKCFPHMSKEERDVLARRHFKMLGRSALELSVVWYGSKERALSLVELVGREHLDKLKGAPVILFAPHFVGLDIGGAAVGNAFQVCSMYSHQKNAHINRAMLDSRLRWGDPVLVRRQEGLRPLVRHIKQGLPFYYLPDMDFGEKDAIFVPFFGVPTATVTAMSRLARLTGAAIVPCITHLKPDGKTYETRLHPPWENYPGASIEEDTRRMNVFLEERILEAPEQYLWAHKRFKTRPPGEKSFYT
jgi:KDO2-lipid IV(A) lauroyltransferase